VLIDPELLPSLPTREWSNGLAELVKHGMVADRALFEWIEGHADQLTRPTVLDAYPLERSAQIKGDIVCEDEREADRRSVLNYGHTVGHAVERASGYVISHGRAVAVGLVVEARVAVDRGLLAADCLARLEQLLERLALSPEEAAPLPRFDELSPFVNRDKKRRQGELRLALPAAVGSALRQARCYTVAITIDELRDAWQRTLDRKGPT
jgi:3-dehydroquinate synthase